MRLNIFLEVEVLIDDSVHLLGDVLRCGFEFRFYKLYSLSHDQRSEVIDIVKTALFNPL